jgi:Flp pilus assembly pilin Flp
MAIQLLSGFVSGQVQTQFKGPGKQLGVTAIEYVMIAAIIAVVIIAVFGTGLGDALGDAFETISDLIGQAGDQDT